MASSSAPIPSAAVSGPPGSRLRSRNVRNVTSNTTATSWAIF
jgi:hypothetical protein